MSALSFDIPPFTFPKVPYPKQWPIYQWIQNPKCNTLPPQLLETINADLSLHQIPVLFWNAFPSGVQPIPGIPSLVQRTALGHWSGAIQFPSWHPDQNLDPVSLNSLYFAHGGLDVSLGDGWISWRADRPGDFNYSDYQNVISGIPPTSLKFFTMNMAIRQTENVGRQMLTRALFLTTQNQLTLSSSIREWILEYLSTTSPNNTSPRQELPQMFLQTPKTCNKV